MKRSYTPVIVLCAMALFVPLLLPLLTGQVFAFDDLANFELPLRYSYREALRAGDSFLWTPALYSGFYVYGEGQAGMAHPLHLLLYRYLPLGVAFNVEIISSYVALLGGMRLLLPRYGLSREAAWFGAMAFTFSGFNLLHLVHVNAIAVVSHAPWLLLAAHVLLSSARPRDRAWAFGGVAFLIGSQLLLGYPQYVWLVFLAVGYQSACLLLARTATPSRLLLLGGAVLCGAFIGGVQLVPTMDALRTSLRSDVSLPFRMSYSLEPRHLMFLWAPNVFRIGLLHELSAYDGAFAIVALAWMAVRWRNLTHRRLASALLGFAALNLVLALGPYGGIYPLLSRLPGLDSFRAPARYIVLLHLALAGIAAVAFDDMAGLVRSGERVPRRRLWPVAVPALLGVTTTLAAAWASHHGGSATWQTLADRDFLRLNLLHAWPWSCGIVAVALLVVLAARGRRWAVAALIVAVALDQGVWGYTYVYGLTGQRVQPIDRLVASADAPHDARPGELLFEPLQQGSDMRNLSNLSLLRGLRRASGYVALVPARVLDPADSVTQRIAGVAWRLDGAVWSRVTGGMPRARLVSEARWSADIRADLHALDVSRVALVDTAVPPLSGEPGSTRLVSDRPGAIVVETTATGRQLLVVTERFHEGWAATEDGTPRPVIRVFGDYLGCIVDPGVHRIVLQFAPHSLRTGLIATTAGVLLTLAMTLWLRRGKNLPPIEERKHAAWVE